jgi:hypothetical protein
MDLPRLRALLRRQYHGVASGAVLCNACGQALNIPDTGD